jgi:hypothetical protein
MRKGNGNVAAARLTGGKDESIVPRHVWVLTVIVMLIGGALGVGMITFLKPQNKPAYVEIDDDAWWRPIATIHAPQASSAQSTPTPVCEDRDPSHKVDRLSDQPSARSESGSLSGEALPLCADNHATKTLHTSASLLSPALTSCHSMAIENCSSVRRGVPATNTRLVSPITATIGSSNSIGVPARTSSSLGNNLP